MEKFLKLKVNQLVCLEFPNVKWSNEPVGKRIIALELGPVYIFGPKIIPIKFEEHNEYYFPYIKSLLQKAIRRQETDIALSCCKYMMTTPDGINQVVRRLLIIMVEDTTVFEKEFIILSYLTTRTEFDIKTCNWLLGLVKKLCQAEKIIVFGPISKELELSIKLRVSYGGLKCDMELLKNIRSSIYEAKVEEIDVNTVPNLHIKNEPVFIAAMDFHVSDIDKLISDKTELEINKIRSIIWDHRSNVNTRIPKVSEENLEILELFDKLSYQKIKNYICK